MINGKQIAQVSVSKKHNIKQSLLNKTQVNSKSRTFVSLH